MDFVTFKIARKLKDLGFNIPFYFYYRTDDKYIHHAVVGKPLIYSDKIDDEVIIAPTISQVLKWLREEKYLHLEIKVGSAWAYDIYKISSNGVFVAGIEGSLYVYTSYELAALAGIEYVFDNLI